jgi:predicted peptidase
MFGWFEPKLRCAIAVFAALMILCGRAEARDELDGFAARVFVAQSGTQLPYRLFVPDDTEVARLPLVLYLHGSGGAGTDNRAQATGGNALGTQLWTEPRVQTLNRSFVVAPQIPVDATWTSDAGGGDRYADLVFALISDVVREFSVDEERLYLVGQSLGGFGAWALISERPALFAAAVPLCGGGDPKRVGAAHEVAVWAFHGAMDRVVPVGRSREMVTALRAAGGSVRYTEYPDAGHDLWTRAFAEPDLPSWLFAQTRKRE